MGFARRRGLFGGSDGKEETRLRWGGRTSNPVGAARRLQVGSTPILFRHRTRPEDITPAGADVLLSIRTCTPCAAPCPTSMRETSAPLTLLMLAGVRSAGRRWAAATLISRIHEGGEADLENGEGVTPSFDQVRARSGAADGTRGQRPRASPHRRCAGHLPRGPTGRRAPSKACAPARWPVQPRPGVATSVRCRPIPRSIRIFSTGDDWCAAVSPP